MDIQKKSSVRKADPNPDDLRLLARFACLLWPDSDPIEHAAAFSDLLGQSDGALFLAYDGHVAVGFAQCQLRGDYVEGTDTSPVGYLEGIYVDPAFRS